jgi:phosphate starvation-inducible PhoH-like protein
LSVETDNVQARDLQLEPADNARLANLCGPLNEHLQQVERRLGVSIANRGHSFRITGLLESARAADAVLKKMYAVTLEQQLSAKKVHLFLQDSGIEEMMKHVDQQERAGDAVASDDMEPGEGVRADGDEAGRHVSSHGQASSVNSESAVVRVRRGFVNGRGANQNRYINAIQTHDINFGIGPAGTGKTYLAVACAVEALETEAARRVVLVRPAVEAGERLGFLPGDLAQKVDPYLRPLYDALYEMLGFERVAKLIERGIIEIAPLAYMRGRTLNESFIILDEAQNTSAEQMKMFLTRIGFGSTAVVTGDVTQIDLPKGQRSGLVHVAQVLRDVEELSFTHFESKDVVRHPIVRRILDAYAVHERNESQ